MSAKGTAKLVAKVFKILMFGSFKPGAFLIFSLLNSTATDSLEILGNCSSLLSSNHLGATMKNLWSNW